MNATHVLGIALGGALGSVARYGVGALATQLFGADQPWGTFAVNLVGSFLLGMILAAAASGSLSESAKLALGTGVMGGFTTYSTFSAETFKYLENGQVGFAAGYATATLLICLAATAAGTTLARALLA